MTYDFDEKKYKESLKNTQPSHYGVINCPYRCDTKGMSEYAKQKGCTPPELTDEEKDRFFYGKLKEFRKFMKDNGYYTGF